MTKSILHHIKKLLRIGAVLTVIAGSTVNASAQTNHAGDCEFNTILQLNLDIEKSDDFARIKQ